MRTPFVAANWKMNCTRQEAERLARELVERVGALDGVDIALCPPYTAIETVRRAISGSRLHLGAQDVHWERQGAFTGEVSAEMLREAECEFVIIGHSERRQYFGETDESVNRRLKAAAAAGLGAIMCVGERLVERESGRTIEVVERQLKDGLDGVGHEKITIAYEPVWAIGTGKVATPEQAQEVHGFIRRWLRARYGEAADRIRIQYGGGVKPDNVDGLMAQPDIDGSLVGGASLQAESFCGIVRGSVRTKRK